MTNDNQTAPAAIHTPEPWDCGGCTTLYATPDESGEITMIELRANVTEASWDTVAFLEAAWPAASANARRICAAVNACHGIPTDALGRGAVARLVGALQAIVQAADADPFCPIGHVIEHGSGRTAGAALDEAAGGQPEPIIIEVRGGIVQDVHNVPPGYQVEIRDYDCPEPDAA